MHNDYNIVAITLAALLHALLVVAMLFAFDFSRDRMPATPLAIKGSLVVEADIPRSPDPEPEPVATEPDPEPEPEPEPDLAEEQRRVAEEQKRLEEQQAEQRRIEAEQERIREEQAAERERQQKAAEEQRRREEAEKERQRQEAERKRQEDLERQRAENERRRREAEEAERQRRLAAELAEEEARAAAMNSGEMARYLFALQQKIQRNWVQPASSHPGIECVVLARQAPGGEVISVTIERCNGDAAVQRSIEAAVYKASPLPQPENPVLFDRNLRITVKPEQ
ncbi:MAG: cell envelope integrity protein TolA [Woeseia sp.]